MIKNRRPIYFPALSAAFSKYMTDGDAKTKTGRVNFAKDKSIHFFNEKMDPYFHHPYVLFSAAHHYKLSDLKKTKKIGDETLIFLDSGGFQKATATVGKEYTDQLALTWCENNGDIFPILDRPLIKGCNVIDHANISAEAAKFYVDNRTDPTKTILNVLSFREVDHFDMWYNKVSQYPLDGWGLGGHAGKIKLIIQGIIYLINKKEHEKREKTFFHIFGVSTVQAMIYFALVQKLLNEMDINIQLTYDSSTFQRNLAYGSWFLFGQLENFQLIKYSNRFDYKKCETAGIQFLPCDCPVCQPVHNLDEYFNDTTTFYCLGSMHNLYIMLRYKRMVDSLLMVGPEEMIGMSFNKKYRNNFNVIKKSFQNLSVGIDSMAHFEEVDAPIDFSGETPDTDDMYEEDYEHRVIDRKMLKMMKREHNELKLRRKLEEKGIVFDTAGDFI